MTTFTLKGRYTIDGAVYKNLKITQKATTGAKVLSCVMTALAIAPIFLAAAFGPMYFLTYIASILIGIMIIGLSIELGVDSTIDVYNHDGMAEYKDELSKSVANTLVQIAEYEEEIKNNQNPDILYQEVLDKMTKYREIVKLGKGSVAEKDLGLYHKNMQLLLTTCQKIRQDNLLATTEVLHSTLQMMGQLQKDK